MELKIIFTIFPVLLIWLYIIHIRLIKKKNKALEAFSGVDVQLKKRYDLIPNLVNVAKGYMAHEKVIFEKIAELRASAMKLETNQDNISRKISLNNAISDNLGQVMALAENYPELKANEIMLNLMQNLNDVEEHIAAARRFYNSAVNELNNMVEMFPSNIIATFTEIMAFDFLKQKISKNSKNLANI